MLLVPLALSCALYVSQLITLQFYIFRYDCRRHIPTVGTCENAYSVGTRWSYYYEIGVTKDGSYPYVGAERN